MRNWTRTLLVCFVLVGGTALFSYYLLLQFNTTLDSLTASSVSVATLPSTPPSVKGIKEQPPAKTIEVPAPSSTPMVTTSTLATSTELNVSFSFPQKNNELFTGCTYQVSLQSSTTLKLLETTLIDANTVEAVEPDISGLATENKLKSDSQSLDWKVGAIWPGKFYIKVTSIDGVALEKFSEVFMVSTMPKSLSDKEKNRLCKESQLAV